MGLLDLPGPLFAWLDAGLSAVLPPALTLAVWALLGAVLSMELYRLLSPQGRIAALKDELQVAQSRLSQFDGEFGEAMPLIGRTLSLAGRRILTVLPATLAASLPMLALIVWVDTTYGRSFPRPGEPAPVAVQEPYSGQLLAAPDAERARAEVLDARGELVAEVEMKAPVPVVHKKRWWNVIIGNPAGYLDSNAPIDRIAVTLPRRDLLGAGPEWVRGWELIFFTALVVFSFAFKSARRIQ